jgi:Resolvase, N terminal domain
MRRSRKTRPRKSPVKAAQPLRSTGGQAAGRVRALLHRCPGPHRPARRAIALGVKPNGIYVDHGLTGTNRPRPGPREALAACRSGDTLVVTKVDRLARSRPDVRDIVAELTEAGVKLNIGGSIHDPNDPVGRLLFNVLAMIAEFDSDVIRMRTREGMKAAKAKGRLRGKQPKLKPAQEKHLVELWRPAGAPAPSWPSCSASARSTIYRAVQRAGMPPSPARPVRQ